MKDKLLVISGCGGFIGSTLAGSLAKENIDILGLDIKFNSRYRGGNFRFLKLDVSNPKEVVRLKRYVRGRNIYLVHLAGIPDVNTCQQSAGRIHSLNILPLINLCNFLQGFKVRKIIFASTALVYGTGYRDLIREDFLPKPENAYARAKLEAERFLLGFARKHKIPAVVLRLANVYGPGMKETVLIPTILRQLNNAKLALREYASIRDYLYIKDAVRAFKSAVFSDHRFDVYNVSTSRGYAVDEVVRIAAKALKKEGPAPEAGSGPAGAGKLVMSHARIKRDLGWEPRYDLDKGIGEVVRSRAQDKISGVKL